MKRRRNPNLIFFLLLTGVIAILAAVTFVNLSYLEERPLSGDFLTHWNGIRGFLTEGNSPYGEDATRAVQRLAYGRLARGEEAPLYFNAPLYAIIVYAPFALMENAYTAAALWMTLLEVCLLALIYLSVRLTRWRPGPLQLGLFFIFALLWYHSLSPLLLGNEVILIAMLVAGGFLAIRAGFDELAGILLAITTIRPYLTILLIVYLLIWSVTLRRWRLLTWLLGALFIFFMLAQLLMPGWALDYVRELLRLGQNTPYLNLRSALETWIPAMSGRISTGISIFMAVILITEFWIFRAAEFRGLFWTGNLALVITQWIGLPTSPVNFILLLPALALVFSVWEERWRRAGSWLTWVSMGLLFFGVWALSGSTFAGELVVRMDPVLYLPLPAFLVVTLYWIRWWAVRPPSVWFDWVYEQEMYRKR